MANASAPTTTATPQIVLGVSPAEDILDDIESLRVDQGLGRPWEATIRFFDVEGTIFGSSRLDVGTAVQVKLPGASGPPVAVFAGTVAHVALEQGANGVSRVTVTARDAAAAFRHSTTIRTYVESSLTDVVEAIAGQHGLGAKVDAAGGTTPYFLQLADDHATLSRLAWMLGYDWYVADKTLHFRRRPDLSPGDPLVYGRQLRQFSASYDGTAVPQTVTVRSWNVQDQQPVVGMAQLSTPSTTQLGTDATLFSAQYAKAFKASKARVDLVTANVRDNAEAETLAQAIAVRHVRAGVRVEGVALGTSDVVVGGTVTVERVHPSLAGTYHVTRVVHEFGADSPAMTRFECHGDPVDDTTMSASVGSDAPWASKIVIGKVTNLKDPDRYGRIKVKFPGLGDQIESAWARVAMPSGGGGHGVDIRPDMNDEVLVGFERGDTRYPVVLGALWNPKALPSSVGRGPGPQGADPSLDSQGSINRRAIHSRDSNWLVLSDGKGSAAAQTDESYVELAHKAGVASIRVGQTGIVVQADQKLPISLTTGEASITLDQGNVTIEGTKVVLKATQAVEVEGSQQVTVKGSQVGLQAQSRAELKGAMVAVQGQSITEVKGAIVKIN